MVSTIWLGARENFYRGVEGKKKRNEKKDEKKSKREEKLKGEKEKGSILEHHRTF